MPGTKGTHKENKAASGTQNVKKAVVQAAPFVFNRNCTLEKVHALAREAARQGAQLVLFPQALISAYPRGDSTSARHRRSDERLKIHHRNIGAALLLRS